MNITTARLDPSNADRIVVFADAFLISNDRGDHWQIIQPTFNPRPEDVYLTEFEIDPHNSRRMYAVFSLVRDTKALMEEQRGSIFLVFLLPQWAG